MAKKKKKQKTRIKTEFTQLKSVRVAHKILEAIPVGVSFSDFVAEAMKRELARLRRREAKVSKQV